MRSITLTVLLVIALETTLTLGYQIPVKNGVRCSTVCTGGPISSTAPKFEPFTAYIYDFGGKTTIVAPTSSKEGTSKILIKGKVQIISLPNCGALLSLHNIEIKEGAKVYSDTNLEGNPVLFSYNNGLVGSEICASDEETVASLNIKRGIISSLQVSTMQNSDSSTTMETDILGTCGTSYTMSSKSGKLAVLKKKDFSKCTEHEFVKFSVLSNMRSNQHFQSSPFSKAELKSEIIVDNQTIISVANDENYHYQPLSYSDSVTTITVNTRIVFKKKYPDTAQFQITHKLPIVPRSIIFEKPTPNAGATDAESLVAATRMAAANMEPVVSMGGSKSFSDLITLLKTADSNDILLAFSQIKSGAGIDNAEVAKSIFVDALIRANSGNSIAAVATLVKNKEISDLLAATWFMNLANSKSPSLDSLVATSDLLNGNVQKEAYIGIGSMIGNYLADKPTDYKKPEIDKALENLAAPLKHLYKGADEDMVIASLKGIGNVNYLNDDLAEFIAQLIMNDDVRPRIRIAALNMVKTYAQNPKIQEACNIVFADKSEDSEIRIKSFLVFAMYPTSEKASIIKHVLISKVTSNQIRSYLYSYLKNLQSTKDKLDQKSLYEGIIYGWKKNELNDPLRYSKNLEFSHQSLLLKSGFVAGGDIIYSYKEFVPRSTSIFLKTSLFGRNFDLFEVDYRGENIDPILESLFGPRGYITKNKAYLFNDATSFTRNAIEYAKYRAANRDFESKSTDIPTEINESRVNIDLALKIMGNDAGWFTFHGKDSQVTYQDVIDNLYQTLDDSIDTVEDAAHIKDLNIRKFIPLVDNERSYATMTGFAINLEIQASAAIKLNMNNEFDIENYLSNPQNANLAFKLMPSGSLDISTKLTVDGYIVEVGNKIMASAHTSTGSSFSVKSVKGRGFEMSVGLPLKEMDLLSVNAEAFAILQELKSVPRNTLITTDAERKSYSRSIDELADSTGLSLDLSYSFPLNENHTLYTPYDGPAAFSLKVKKVDESMMTYVLRGSYSDISPTKKSINLFFTTPKSEVNRDVLLTLLYDIQPNAMFAAQLMTSSKKISLGVQLTNNDLQKSIELKYKGDSQHTITLGVKCVKDGADKTRYYPLLKAEYVDSSNTEPQKYLPNMTIEGDLLVEESPETQRREFTFEDLAIVTPVDRRSLQGSIVVDDSKFGADMYVSTGTYNISTKAEIHCDNPIYELEFDLDVVQKPQSISQLPSDDQSRLVSLSNSIKKIKINSFQSLRLDEPYEFKSSNYIEINDDFADMNANILIKDKQFSMDGNIQSTNLFDYQVDGRVKVVPRSLNSGIILEGVLSHVNNNDASDNGIGKIAFVESPDKSHGVFELDSQCPNFAGVFNILSEYKVTDDSLYLKSRVTVRDDTKFNAELDLHSKSIKVDISYKVPGSETAVLVRVLSKAPNSVEYETKIIWPGPDDINYFVSNGAIKMNGLDCEMSGYLDYPLADLRRITITMRSVPNAGSSTDGEVNFECVSNDILILSGIFNYTLANDNGQVHIRGDGLITDSLDNSLSVDFGVDIVDYVDKMNNQGTEMSYFFIVPNKNKSDMRSYRRALRVTKREFSYEQLYQIGNQNQIITIDFEYDFEDLLNMSYKLTAKIETPSIFHTLLDDKHNKADFLSTLTINENVFEKQILAKVYSTDGNDLVYELKLRMDSTKAGLKLMRCQRSIVAAVQYDLKPTDSGYTGSLSAILWLDRIKLPNSKSSLSIDGQYSMERGLSGSGTLRLTSPAIGPKDMSINTTFDVLKNWENLFDMLLDLNVFPTVEQRVTVASSLVRTPEDDGVRYTALLTAQSPGLKMDYGLKESILITPEKWGNNLESYFIDYNNVKRPICMEFEITPGGFTNEINILDITKVSAKSSFGIKDGVLRSKSTINYNGHVYKIGSVFTTTPDITISLEWNDRAGNLEILVVKANATLDDSAVVSGMLYKANSNEPTPVGYIKKSLSADNWLETENGLDNQQVAYIIKALKTDCFGRVVDMRNNMKSIEKLLTNQLEYQMADNGNLDLQFQQLDKYINDQYRSINEEISGDVYLNSLPTLCKNLARALLFDLIDLIKFSNIIEILSEQLEKLEDYLHQAYDDALISLNELGPRLMDLYNMKIDELKNCINAIISQIHHLIDTTGEPSSSVRDYVNGLVNDSENSIKTIRDALEQLKQMVENYIKQLPSYAVIHDYIESLNSYQIKEKIWNWLHNYLLRLRASATSKDAADLITAVDNYLDKVFHSGLDNTETDVAIIKDKSHAVMKDIVNNYHKYLTYGRAMAVTDFLRNIENCIKTTSRYIGTNSAELPGNLYVWFDLKSFLESYNSLINPIYSIPPFLAEAMIIDSNNVITINDVQYSFIPNSGSYVLAKDFKDLNFSIVGNYEDSELMSVTVSVDNSQTLVLHSGGQITVNDKVIDFPMMDNEVRTFKDFDTFGVKLSAGVDIVCVLDLSIVYVSINGYYHDYVHGILGSINHEPTLDYTMINGQVAKDLEMFVSEYQIAGKDSPEAVEPNNDDQSPCPSLFSGSSSLRPAFWSLSPIAYRATCNQLVSVVDSPQDKMQMACLVAKAYTMIARYNYQPVSIPQMCQTSELNKRTLDSNSQIEIDGPFNSMDVIVLFEKVIGNQEIFLEFLIPLIESLKEDFKSKGITDMRFVGIGFSESLLNPDMTVYMPGDEYSRDFSYVPFDWTDSLYNQQLDKGKQEITREIVHFTQNALGRNSMENAFKYAVNYPIRPEANKVILAAIQSVHFNKVLNTLDLSLYSTKLMTLDLVEQDAKAHLIGPMYIQDANNEGVFGLSGDTVYSKSVPAGQDTQIPISYQKSLETGVASTTGGAMFDSEAFRNASAEEKDIIMRSLSKAIADKASIDSNMRKTCINALYNGMTSYPKCTVLY